MNSFDKYIYQDGGLPITMGITTNIDFTQGMIEYKDKKYDKAISLFEKLGENDTIDYYIGNSYLYLNNPEKASLFLSKDNKGFYYQSRYNLAICYIKINQIEKAKSILMEISKSEHFLCDKAKKLLEEI